MSRSSAKRKSQTISGALILGDAVKARRDARRRYERVCAMLEEKNNLASQFRDVDRPAFERWIEAEFAREIAANRRAHAELADLNTLVQQVQLYADAMGCSHRDALQAIRSAKESGTEEALWDAIEKELYGASDTSDARAEADPFSRSAEDEERSNTKNERTRNRSERRRQDAEERKGLGSGATDYLKALYRRLVRLLHPDLRGEMSPLERQQWQEAQDAYSWRDVQRLEKLVATVEKSSDGEHVLDFETIPVGDIVELRRDAERRLSVIGQDIAKYKKEVAWNFTKTMRDKRALIDLRRGIRVDLLNESAEIQLMLDHLDSLLASIEQQSQRRRREPAVKSRKRQDRSRDDKRRRKDARDVAR